MTDKPPSPDARPAGPLTAVMRAAAPAVARRALRIGIVHRGKVVDERVFEPGQHVTIGPNERATFVLAHPSVPSNHRLFESTGDTFELRVAPWMKGRVARSSGIVDVAALHAAPDSAEAPGDARTIPLTPDARGKLHIGDVVVLFQIVPDIAPRARPELPPNMKSGLGDVDWRTSLVAAFSFLVHFGAVGSIYSDWMDPVVDDEVETAQLLETVRALPPPPPVERPKDDAPSAAATAAATAAPAAGPKAKGPSGGRVATAGPAGGGGRAGDARAHQISHQLEALEMQMLVGLNGSSGPATSAVLGTDSGLPLGMLDEAAASAAGARPANMAGLDIGASNTVLRPGQIPRGPLPGDPSPTPVPSGPGPAPTVKPPTPIVPVPGVLDTGGAVPNAASVVAGMTAGLRRCYNNGLNREDPTMKGTVRFTVRVGPNGEVLSVSGAPSGNLSASVVGCMRSRVASAQFAPPTGGGAVLIIPVSVTSQ